MNEENGGMESLIKALVYRDHLGRGWYAYCPTAEDSLDAEGNIPASCFETREEAIEAVRKAIAIAVSRPGDTAEGMAEFDLTV